MGKKQIDGYAAPLRFDKTDVRFAMSREVAHV